MATAAVASSFASQPCLLPALGGRLYLVAFEVAIELAGGKDVQGKVLHHGETSAQYELKWHGEKIVARRVSPLTLRSSRRTHVVRCVTDWSGSPMHRRA